MDRLEGDEPYLEAVPPTEARAAARQFGRWLADRGLQREAFAEVDVVVDVIRWGDGGTRHRYWVRRAALPCGADAPSDTLPPRSDAR